MRALRAIAFLRGLRGETLSERKNPVFVALDTPELARALELASMLVRHVDGFKVGLEFLTATGTRACGASSISACLSSPT
jgi:orotidine-5'-phosphate decarboxylase